MRQIIIAIDGHSSCGKSTLARSLAQEFEYKHIDSGAMYRAITHYLLEEGIDVGNEVEVSKSLDDVSLILKNDAALNTILLLNGKSLDQELRSAAVNHNVSQVAKISDVRSKLVAMQRTLGSSSGVVMDGRDIGTVVFPDAQLKLFLTADQAVRTRRRYDELLAKDELGDMTIEAIDSNLRARDEIDSNRAHSPLLVATDAIVINNSNLTREEQHEMIACLARRRGT